MPVLIPVARCDYCPHHSIIPSSRYGCAVDFHCGAAGDKLIVSGVEITKDIPNEPPEWCPFRATICTETTDVQVGDRVQTIKGNGAISFIVNDGLICVTLDGRSGDYLFSKNEVWKIIEGDSE